MGSILSVGVLFFVFFSPIVRTLLRNPMDGILHGQCQCCVIWCGGVTSHVSSEPNKKNKKKNTVSLIGNHPETMENFALTKSGQTKNC